MSDIKDKVQQCKERLREAGLKVTPQRIAVFEVLTHIHIHPTVEYVYSQIKKRYPGMSLATVYNVLKSLQKAGLICEIGALGDICRYDGNAKPHPHIICYGCQKIEDLEEVDLDLSKIEQSIIDKAGFRLLDGFFTLYGYCKTCEAKIRKREGY